MERFGCQALVLSTVDYGESDRVVTLLTDDHGRLGAFAPGARKSRRRFAGALEPFTLLKVRLVEGRGDLCRLEAAEVLDGFGELREEMGRAARAAYAVELCRELAREREPVPGLFSVLSAFLVCLARQGGAAMQMMRFELDALAAAGLMPRLDACSRCGELAPEDALFDPEHGGIVCARCAQTLAVRVSGEASRALAALQREGELPEPPRHVRAEARALLSRFIAHHLGRSLKSLEFMRQVGIEA
jgi:DNA repair protein RecO (recombination protein O)